MGREITPYAVEKAGGSPLDRSADRDGPPHRHFETHHFAFAPRHDPNARTKWVQQHWHKPGHPPSWQRSGHEAHNISDLGGQAIAPGDLVKWTLYPPNWMHIWLAQGPRIACPIWTLLYRNTFRLVIWEQARGIMLMPSQARWREFIAERLSVFGITIKPPPVKRRLRPWAQEEDEDDGEEE